MTQDERLQCLNRDEKLQRLKDRATGLGHQLLTIEEALEEWSEDLGDLLTLIVNLEDYLKDNGVIREGDDG